MEFTIRERVNQPLETVWKTYRDRLPELVAYLPNVSSIEVVEREGEDEDHVRLVNEWCVAGAVPSAVRRFFKEEMLRYKDFAEWDWPEKVCRWRNEFPALPKGLTSRGTNIYAAAGPDACEIEINGNLSVDLSAVRGIPRIFRRFAPQVEKFVIERIKPNLVEVCRAVEKLLAEEAGG